MNWNEKKGKRGLLLKVLCLVMVVVLMITSVAAYTQTAAMSYVAAVGQMQYASVAEAVAAANGQTVKLLRNSSERISVSGDLYLDLNGYVLAGLTMTDGTLYGMDSTTDDYNCSDGYGEIYMFAGAYEKVNNVGSGDTAKRYLALENQGGLSFHRIYVGITYSSLKPDFHAVGYKAVFAADWMVVAQLHETEAFGYQMQLDEYAPVQKWKSAADFVSGEDVTLRVQNYDSENYGTAPLSAAVQVKLADGTIIRSSETVRTLQQMVETVNSNVADYTRQQLDALATWIRSCDTMMGWQVEEILNPAAVPTIRVTDVVTEPGQSVQVPVMIENNPGVAGAKITLTYGSDLILTDAVTGDAFAELQYTGPGMMTSPCNFTWDSESGMVTENGTILVLTFQVPADAAPGTVYTLACSYRAGDFYDEDLVDVEFATVDGSITVEQKQSSEHTVTFKDYDGSVLKTQKVADGGSATAPQAPQREGYIFVGWDVAFDCVTTDLVVTAQYQQLSGAAFVVANVTAEPGQRVEVPVTVVNNPGVAGAKITINYGSELVLTNAVNGEAFSNLQFTKSGQMVSPCSFTWDSESGMATADGTILVLTFDVPASAAGKTIDLVCTYRVGDIYDEDLNDVDFTVISGSVQVKSQDAQKFYTVTFKDYDGSVLKTETVLAGEAATAPANPERSGYLFTGWDVAFDAVTSDLVVTAQYEAVTVATIMVPNVTAAPGQSVQVAVRIVNNPGVAGAKITMRYDSALTLTGAVNGDAFSFLQFTKSGTMTSPCNFTWDSESGMATEDGTILILTYQIPANAAIGQVYTLDCSYRSGDIYDENLDDVDFVIISGSITVG